MTQDDAFGTRLGSVFVELPEAHLEVVRDFCDLLRQFAGPGRFAMAVAGSRGKGTSDAMSDIDMRVYADVFVKPHPDLKALERVIQRGRDVGCVLDHVWPRTICEVEAALSTWCDGQLKPLDLAWTIWGYHLLTDIASQLPVFDPDNVVASWHDRLKDYPSALKQAILEKHLGILRHWRNDGHYLKKLERGDTVFLASVATKIVHSAFQILCAINETYYPGDGWNMAFGAEFQIKPDGLAERVQLCLYPKGVGEEAYRQQYAALMGLIDAVDACLEISNN